MHLAPMMAMPYAPSTTPTKLPSSRPRQTQETPASVPAPRLVHGERRVKPRLSKPSLDPVLESDQRLSRDVEQMVSEYVPAVTRKHSLPILSRKGSDFFEEAFGSRKTDEPGDRIRNESVVLAHIQTNVIIEDELIFITELSEYLSLRYNRPSSSIVTTVQHGICTQFGGSSDPCYIMKIEALARDLQPATNKRNIALFQTHMYQALRIPPSRGFLRFVPLAEDCAGWKGNTVAGEIAKAMEQAQSVTERRGSIRAPSRRSSKAFRDMRNKMTTTEHTPTPSSYPGTSASVSTNHLSIIRKDVKGAAEAEKEKTRTINRRRSFIHGLFPRSISRSTDREVEGENKGA